MLNIKIQFDDIQVSNINKEDLSKIKKWMERQKQFLQEETDLNELKERFLESYISECEFFLKINKNLRLLGILKGRLEFKNPNEAWIWFFYLDDNYRIKQLTNRILEQLMKYFFDEYGIEVFFTRVVREDKESVMLWENIGFEIIRVVKNFYSIDGKYMDMIIMKKIGV